MRNASPSQPSGSSPGGTRGFRSIAGSGPGTKPEAERVGKYMTRPVLSLERLSLLEREAKVGYRSSEDGGEQETMDYLEFIARVTSHIPDKGQVMVRYYGLYASFSPP